MNNANQTNSGIPAFKKGFAFMKIFIQLRHLLLLLLCSWSLSAAAIETIVYYHNDPAGSPVAITDGTPGPNLGNLLWREHYRPYGDRVVKQPAGNNQLWFHNKPQDEQTGLSYFGARYYDPIVGRFMGVDPQHFDENNLHSFNRYAYGNNNPYRFTDPDGHHPILLYMAGGAVMGGATAALVNAGVQYYKTGSVQMGGIGGVWDAAGDGAMMGTIFGIAGGVEAGVAASLAGTARGSVAKSGLSEARAARDALAAELAPLKGKAPATVTGGYNVNTGEVAARACGGGKCAEDHVVGALGGAKGEVRFTEAVRPRTGQQVPVCPNCEASYGRGSFPSGTQFKTD